MIYIGTSGFQYDDWVGTFYPEDLPKQDWLTYYAHDFDTLEINFTYYRMPTAKGLLGMAKKVPANFEFTVKATQEMTHARERDAKVFEQFKNALTPLVEQNKFGAILAQFPNSFRANDESQDYLKWFHEQLEGWPVVVEFRNKEWLTEGTYEFLQREGLGFCCVDEPYFPRVARVTAPIAYVRFHGRNYQKWWKHDQAYERYDYTYKTEELEEWTLKIEQMNETANKTYVFANNHYRAQGVATARQLKLMLPESEQEH